ncbi:unnamed protein product [marine sediment metagenome]|uniref:Uncharacterized protein n=1 Tax=marine sediment metagenome TaxID=412755 RepID=X0SZH0_9ZZZZ
MNESINNRILSGQLKLISKYSVAALVEHKTGAPVKWTEDKALELGKHLKAWMEADLDNLFVDEFLITYGLYGKLIHDLCNKYSNFRKIYGICTEIQRFRLVRGGLNNEFNPMFDKFILVNHHKYKDKVTTEEDNNGNRAKQALSAWNERKQTGI